MNIDYLLVGHVARDITPDGEVWGGTAYYSAITAQRLGASVAVVTSAAEVEELRRVLTGIEVAVVPTERTTTFENRYHGNQREQLLHYAAPPLTFDTIPEAWRNAKIVHFAPIAQDVEPTLLAQFPHSLLTVTPQGWMRQWDARGRVQYRTLPSPSETLRAVDALVFSAEDVANDWDAMKALIDAVPLAVVTQAAEGAVVYNQDGAHPMPVRPATMVDPTGAGDVFAAAFFLKLYESGHPLEAAAFANVVAAFSIEAQGISGIPSRDTVETWLRIHQLGA